MTLVYFRINNLDSEQIPQRFLIRFLHMTLLQITKVYRNYIYLANYLDRGESVYVVYFDFANAFDKAPIDLLLGKIFSSLRDPKMDHKLVFC